MLAPRHVPYQRLPIADELIAVSATSRHRTFGLMGMLWRTVDLFLLGDPVAERALNDLRLRAGQHDFLVGHYVVAAIDTMLLVRAGRLTEAEAAAADCHRLGGEAGDEDADGWYLGQLFRIRWLQGRARASSDPSWTKSRRARCSSTCTPPTCGPRRRCSPAKTRTSTPPRVGVSIRASVGGLASLPESSVWLPGMFALAESAVKPRGRRHCA